MRRNLAIVAMTLGVQLLVLAPVGWHFGAIGAQNPASVVFGQETEPAGAAPPAGIGPAIPAGVGPAIPAGVGPAIPAGVGPTLPVGVGPTLPIAGGPTIVSRQESFTSAPFTIDLCENLSYPTPKVA